jgi:DNA-binding NtrC family response regulator
MGYGMGQQAAGNKVEIRSVLLTSPDVHFRERLRRQLTAMRWQVREAAGGAEAMALLEEQGAEALVLDSVLPDLDVVEFARQMRSGHPAMEMLCVDAVADDTGVRSPRRNELLHALRHALEEAQGTDAAPWELAPAAAPRACAADRLAPTGERARAAQEVAAMVRARNAPSPSRHDPEAATPRAGLGDSHSHAAPAGPGELVVVAARRTPEQASMFDSATMRPRPAALPEMAGDSPAMLELARMVRLVAPRSTTVLIQGDTGTGKELVARAVHQLSRRAARPFVVLNCAAIPETLLEAELFGHTRGAFTGAIQSRAGRIEAADGGTLFLDEIGEMPLALQAKMLRFLESGELQRVGDNETIHVDVRVVAASHQPLQQRAAERQFRLDLYHRLAVFPVSVPALRDRMQDLRPLAAHLLSRLGEEMPVKRLSAGAAMRLMEHDWPGNVRELAHVLERGAILAEDRREIAADEIRF